MKNFVRRGIVGLFLAVLTAAVNAQAGMTVTPGSPSPGDTVTIEYTNPALAGQEISVHIDDGGIPPTVVCVKIRLDGAGKGKATWLVPAWCYASFNAPGVEEVTVFIGGGSDDDGGAHPILSAPVSELLVGPVASRRT